MDALDIVIGIAADFELELGVALRPITSDLVRHDAGIFLADGAIELDVVLLGTAEERIDR